MNCYHELLNFLSEINTGYSLNPQVTRHGYSMSEFNKIVQCICSSYAFSKNNESFWFCKFAQLSIMQINIAEEWFCLFLWMHLKLFFDKQVKIYVARLKTQVFWNGYERNIDDIWFKIHVICQMPEE